MKHISFKDLKDYGLIMDWMVELTICDAIGKDIDMFLRQTKI